MDLVQHPDSRSFCSLTGIINRVKHKWQKIIGVILTFKYHRSHVPKISSYPASGTENVQECSVGTSKEKMPDNQQACERDLIH
jgi:hypothetical protein